MKKEIYEIPTLELLRFELINIVTTSENPPIDSLSTTELEYFDLNE